MTWLFPPTLTRRRKIVINLTMLSITVAVAWMCNSPDGWFYLPC